MQFLCLILTLALSPARLAHADEVADLIRQADQLNNAGRVRESVELLARASRLQPDNAQLCMVLGERALSIGDLDRAAENLGRSVDLAPDQGVAHWLLGLVHHRRERHEDALASLQRAAQRMTVSADLHQALGLSLFRLNRFAESAKHFQQAAAGAPQNAEYHYLAGLAASHLPDTPGQTSSWELATGLLQKALALDSRHVEAHFQLGRLHVERGQVDQAIPLLRRALRLRPDHVGVHFALGNALLRSGKREEGRAMLRTFAELEALTQAGEVVERLLLLRPDDAGLLTRRAEICLDRGEAEGVLADLQRAVRLDGESAQRWILIARAHLVGARSDQALQATAKARSLDPINPLTRFYEAQAHYQAQRYPLARDLIEALLADGQLIDQPQERDALQLAASACEQVGDAAAAKRFRERAAEKAGGDAP